MEMKDREVSAKKALWSGILLSAAFTVLIWSLDPLLAKINLFPDQGASWYLWKLPEPTFWTRFTAWTFYLLHQISLWALIYYTQRKTINYSKNLHAVNLAALALNAFFILLHVLQTHIWYDGLAQDVSIWSSQVSVSILLIWVILMENPRRGVFFAIKIPLKRSIIDFARKYHGYFFAWAIVYTFWYHPTISTPGHLVGFFYMFLLLLQGSLFFTRIHVNRVWTFVLEFIVLLHGTLVAIFQGGNLWPMFAFGFGGIFIITQMHGLGFSRSSKVALFSTYALAASWVYSGRGIGRVYELIAIPVIDYLGVLALAGIIAGLLFLAKLFNKARQRVQSSAN